MQTSHKDDETLSKQNTPLSIKKRREKVISNDLFLTKLSQSLVQLTLQTSENRETEIYRQVYCTAI
jgi:hypothetical protein